MCGFAYRFAPAARRVILRARKMGSSLTAPLFRRGFRFPREVGPGLVKPEPSSSSI